MNQMDRIDFNSLVTRLTVIPEIVCDGNEKYHISLLAVGTPAFFCVEFHRRRPPYVSASRTYRVRRNLQREPLKFPTEPRINPQHEPILFSFIFTHAYCCGVV